MIAVDGDSVAVTAETGYRADQKWPHLLAKDRGVKVEVFARAKSTARDCMLRAWRVIASRPQWYVLAVGQWSQNHEPVAEFESYARMAIEEMHRHGVHVCLVTPPAEVGNIVPYLSALHRCSLIYRTAIVDVYENLRLDNADESWFERDTSVLCHFNDIGSQRVLGYFCQPDTSHICRP